MTSLGEPWRRSASAALRNPHWGAAPEGPWIPLPLLIAFVARGDQSSDGAECVAHTDAPVLPSAAELVAAALADAADAS